MAASIRIKQVLGLRSYLDDITEKVDKVDENAAIIPLANSVTNLITTQTLLINLLNK